MGTVNPLVYFDAPPHHGLDRTIKAASEPHILILGGADVNTGAPHAEVWYQ